jgi:hypothetical protein
LNMFQFLVYTPIPRDCLKSFNASVLVIWLQLWSLFLPSLPNFKWARRIPSLGIKLT